MKKKFTETEKKALTDEIFLSMFTEQGISCEELKEAICLSFSEPGEEFHSFEEIPFQYKKEAVEDCCRLAGLKFKNYDDILEYFEKNECKVKLA